MNIVHPLHIGHARCDLWGPAHGALRLAGWHKGPWGMVGTTMGNSSAAGPQPGCGNRLLLKKTQTDAGLLGQGELVAMGTGEMTATQS